MLLSPFWGSFLLWAKQKINPGGGYVYKTAQLSGDQSGKKDIPKENRLVIPSIQLNDEIIDGATFHALDKGIWHRPATSNPIDGGNMVIAGHRFRYTSIGNFYSLDKVKVGDKISVYWDQKEYVYQVDNILVVPPSDLGIEDNTSEPRLTLYTCTPYWSSTDRLVIQSKLVDI